MNARWTGVLLALGLNAIVMACALSVAVPGAAWICGILLLILLVILAGMLRRRVRIGITGLKASNGFGASRRLCWPDVRSVTCAHGCVVVHGDRVKVVLPAAFEGHRQAASLLKQRLPPEVVARDALVLHSHVWSLAPG